MRFLIHLQNSQKFLAAEISSYMVTGYWNNSFLAKCLVTFQKHALFPPNPVYIALACIYSSRFARILEVMAILN